MQLEEEVGGVKSRGRVEGRKEGRERTVVERKGSR